MMAVRYFNGWQSENLLRNLRLNRLKLFAPNLITVFGIEQYSSKNEYYLYK
jgi:hypothetical protein